MARVFHTSSTEIGQIEFIYKLNKLQIKTFLVEHYKKVLLNNVLIFIFTIN